MSRPVPGASAPLADKLADARAYLDELRADLASDDGEIQEAEAKLRAIQQRLDGARAHVCPISMVPGATTARLGASCSEACVLDHQHDLARAKPIVEQMLRELRAARAAKRWGDAGTICTQLEGFGVRETVRGAR